MRLAHQPGRGEAPGGLAAQAAQTHRIDYGMIRRLDGEKGWQAYRGGGILDFPPDMKRRDAGDQRLF